MDNVSENANIVHNKHAWTLLYSYFPLKKVMCLLLPSRLLGLFTKAIIQESWLLQEYQATDKKVSTAKFIWYNQCEKYSIQPSYFQSQLLKIT